MSISLHESKPESPVTRSDIVTIVKEIQEGEQEVEEIFLGISNPWQATVVIVLGVVVFNRVWAHYFGDRKTRQIERAINGFGKDKDGNVITLARFVRQQMRVEKENRMLLYKICRKMGIRRDEI